MYMIDVLVKYLKFFVDDPAINFHALSFTSPDGNLIANTISLDKLVLSSKDTISCSKKQQISYVSYFLNGLWCFPVGLTLLVRVDIMQLLKEICFVNKKS